MSTLLVIAGPPGAGKSTVSSIVSSRLSPSVLLPSVERCVQDVTTREGNRDDEPGTRHMHQQFVQAPIDARHLIIEPTGTPEEVATSILSRYRQGAFSYA
ncbi:hypothetical protein [Actinoplanes friuliensis]|uniref:Uncharacterized protein n=1 Tax=Actinoplanes friuliensis DSM 7358 TaxID=1246995 RepID=U5VV62_9ACTN|nr:hypothetical protein [Actinoplanes friuliensis]AGZ40893.1 hypothetical protein AFR_13035 [Actinoplanes friuliensis DSM 7358]